MMNFLEISFYCCKRILTWQKILEVFGRLYLNFFSSNIIVNVNFFSDLKLEYYCEYNWWEGPWNIFWKNYWAMKHLGLWSPGLRNFFWQICKTLRPPPPRYLMYAPYDLINNLNMRFTIFYYNPVRKIFMFLILYLLNLCKICVGEMFLM